LASQYNDCVEARQGNDQMRQLQAFGVNTARTVVKTAAHFFEVPLFHERDALRRVLPAA
jgi:hypothetical protein